MKVVIVGNGVAGMEAALTVANREPSWEVTLVSEESDHFFSRTALMYVLSGQMSHRDIEPLERDVYARMGFRRVRARATGLDAANKQLLVTGQEPLAYDRLVIACGSRPRPAPFWEGYGELRGVGHFVTMQDLQWLEEEVHGGIGRDRPERHDAHLAHTAGDSPYVAPESRSRATGALTRRPVVVGGGLIGIEVVETLLAAGRKPVFLIREDAFWPIALDKQEAAWVAEALRHHGCDVRFGWNIEKLEGDGQGNLAKVVCDQGDIDADLLVVAIGVVPQTGWLGDALELERGGIVVDEQLRTSAEDVFACGDCASVVWFDGVRRPEQLWYTGRDQGRIAGRNVVGDGVPYRRGTWYNSAKLMDIEYTTAGLVNVPVDDASEWYFEEKGAVRSTTRIVLSGGRIVGFNALGRRWDHEIIIRWIEERRPLDYVLAHLNRARFDTEFVPALKLPAAT